MILYIFIFLLLAVLVYHIYYIKEGIVFTRSYFLDNYETNNILLDRENETLEKNGKIINYKKINNKNGNIDIKPLTNKMIFPFPNLTLGTTNHPTKKIYPISNNYIFHSLSNLPKAKKDTA